MVLESGEFRVTDVDGATVASFEIESAYRFVVAVAFSPDGQRLAAVVPGRLELFDVRAGRRIASVRTAQSETSWVPCDITFSPDGRLLATSDGAPVVLLRSADTGETKTTLHGHGTAVHCVAFSPDGTRLASGGADYTVRLWQVPDGREVAVLHGHAREVDDVAFSASGDLASVGGNELFIWSVD
jgi:WD40 repeat protein